MRILTLHLERRAEEYRIRRNKKNRICRKTLGVWTRNGEGERERERTQGVAFSTCDSSIQENQQYVQRSLMSLEDDGLATAFSHKIWVKDGGGG
jgi:hypothetical protein